MVGGCKIYSDLDATEAVNRKRNELGVSKPVHLQWNGEGRPKSKHHGHFLVKKVRYSIPVDLQCFPQRIRLVWNENDSKDS